MKEIVSHLSCPSAQPDTSELSLLGFLDRQVIPSSWVKDAKKGLANTLSSFAALRALVYSTAFSKGCRLGSRFLWTLRRSCDLSRVYSSSLRLIALTFISLQHIALGVMQQLEKVVPTRWAAACKRTANAAGPDLKAVTFRSQSQYSLVCRSRCSWCAIRERCLVSE